MFLVMWIICFFINFIVGIEVLVLRVLCLLVFFMFCSDMMARSVDLRSLDSLERKDYLISLSEDVIRMFGPGYHRENVDVVVTEEVFDTDDKRRKISRNIGREYYEVTYSYDKSREVLNFDFSAKVRVWKDTGEPLEVIFGNGYCRNFFFEPYCRLKKRKTEVKQVPYQQAIVQEAGFMDE